MSRLEVRVIGPPGTGKTTYLARQVALAAEKYGNDQVVVASFTRAAAGVIAARVDLDGEQVGTLHALCWRALGRPPIAETIAKDWNEHVNQDPGLRITSKRPSHLEDPFGAVEDNQDHDGDELLRKLALYRARMDAIETWPEDVRTFAEVWNEWKMQAGALDFTDLIEQGALMESAPGNPSILMVDEAQDMSPLEWRLVRSWGDAASKGLLVAGDGAQAIYSFKGATPKPFLDPNIPEENWFVLSQSYRVPQAVHARAVSWLQQSSVDVLRAYHPTKDQGSVSTWQSGGASMATWKNPDEVIERIENESSKGRSVMLLSTCSYMLQPSLQALRQRGVPFHNPYRTTNGAWNPMRGGVDRLRAFLEPARPDLLHPEAREPRLWDWCELSRWTEDLKAGGTLKRGVKTEIEARARDDMKRGMDTRDKLTRGDLARLFEPNALAELSAAMVSADPWSFIASRVLPTRAHVYDYVLAVLAKRGAPALTQKPQVVIGTVHSVKGEEAQAVFLYPDLSPRGYEQWNEDGESRDSVVRTFYVGMTRAREDLHLLGASGATAVDWD